MRFIPNIISLGFLFLISCSGAGTGSIILIPLILLPFLFKWIEGKYIVVHDLSGFYYEEWIKVDNNNYEGTGFFLTRDCIDTILSMKMRLMHEKDKTTLFMT